jgi:hypothetical protein
MPGITEVTLISTSRRNSREMSGKRRATSATQAPRKRGPGVHNDDEYDDEDVGGGIRSVPGNFRPYICRIRLPRFFFPRASERCPPHPRLKCFCPAQVYKFPGLRRRDPRTWSRIESSCGPEWIRQDDVGTRHFDWTRGISKGID